MDFKCAKYFIEYNLDYVIDSFNNEIISKEMLEYDLKSLDTETTNVLFEKCKPSNWANLLKVYNEHDEETLKKMHLILEYIKNREQSLFIKKIVETNDPYDNDDLESLTVDSDGLVNVNELIK